METDEKEKNEQVADSPEAAATEEEAGRPVTSFEFLAGAAYDFWEDF
ncbi:MAG: hypothetical protein K2I69_08485 [Muribaculaceae bacterium]|nr:hypothetical protein [Muribaculaceae bacterium]